MNKILITGALHETALDLFANQTQWSVDYRPDIPRAEILERVRDATVLVTRSETAIDKELIEAAKHLKVIGRAAVGVGNIDIDFATERGVLIVNCPGKNTNSAAELTMGLLLCMYRMIPEAQQTVKTGGWDRHRFLGNELKDKSIGIVGLGNVGHRVAKMARGFDMRVLAYDPYISPEVFRRNHAQRCSNLHELCEQVDVLSLHVPLNRETKGFIGEEILRSMKPGARFINAARGGLVDEHALLKVLQEGHIGGVGIDTFLNEPHPMSELVKHTQVVCTPHIGATTDEAQIAIGNTIYEQVRKAVAGHVVDYPVNLPQFGLINNPTLKAYALLAEKLGSLSGQILDFNPSEVELSYRGDIADLEHSLIRLSWMKGYAAQVKDDYVSFVNVESHFDKMAISIVENDDRAAEGYKSALRVTIKGQSDKVLTVGGIVFDDRLLKVSLIDNFHFEMDPSGKILLVENHDRPGVIGDLGHFLAEKGVNISTFELSRNRQGGRAMSLVRLDSELGDLDLRAMRNIKNVVKVRAVNL